MCVGCCPIRCEVYLYILAMYVCIYIYIYVCVCVCGCVSVTAAVTHGVHVARLRAKTAASSL